MIRADVDRDDQGRARAPLRRLHRRDQTASGHASNSESLRNLLKAVLDNSSALIFAKDLEGRFLFVNQPIVTKHGLQKQGVLGKLDSDLFEPDLAARNTERDRQVISSGEVLQFEETRDRLDGPHSLLTTKFPLRDA